MGARSAVRRRSVPRGQPRAAAEGELDPGRGGPGPADRSLLRPALPARSRPAASSSRCRWPARATACWKRSSRRSRPSDDPESFDEFLRALGRDHRKYHVDDRSTTTTMGVALLDALRSTAGDGWNLEYDQAWRDAYAAIAAKMVAGAAADDEPAVLARRGADPRAVRPGHRRADLPGVAAPAALAGRAVRQPRGAPPPPAGVADVLGGERPERRQRAGVPRAYAAGRGLGLRCAGPPGASRATCSGWPRRWGR